MRGYRLYLALFAVLVIDRALFGSDSWNIRICLYYAGVCGFQWYSLSRIRGELTATSIKNLASGQEISIGDIVELIGTYPKDSLSKTFEVDIYTHNSSQEPAMTVALTGEQLIALGGDKLDDWTVDDNDILISPGNESGTRKIRFASLGSYYTHHHLTL